MPLSKPPPRPRVVSIVWPFVLILALRTLLAVASLQLVSTVRAYVSAESLWSKSLGNAVLAPGAYLDGGREEDYLSYERNIRVTLLDRASRRELDASLGGARARELLIEAGNHPDDVAAVVRLFQLGRNLGPFREVIAHWRATDAYLDELQGLASIVRGLVLGQGGGVELVPLKRQLLALHDRMIPKTLAFSEHLGSLSRTLVGGLLATNLLVGLLLIGLAVWRMRSLVWERWRFEVALFDQKERMQVILASIGDAVIAVDDQGRVTYHNPATRRLLGDYAQVTGARLDSLIDIQAEHLPPQRQPLHERLFNGEWAQRDDRAPHLLLRADGGEVPVAVTATLLQQAAQSEGAVLVLHDETRERAFLRDLAWHASHDALTGLVNRREFELRLERLLTQSSWDHASLLFIDLDQFKVVNDTSGHFQGDRLLRQLCGLLESQLSQADTLARLGGDEFGVLLVNREPAEAKALAERLRARSRTLSIDGAGQDFRVGLSIGMVHLGGQNLNPEEALRLADLACYAAKDKGRNRIQVFARGDMELDQRHGEMAWIRRLHRALEFGRFDLLIQPILGLSRTNRRTRHVEVLLRLIDDEGGLIGPGAFIPAAERYGLMVALDRWVLEAALTRLAALPPGIFDTCAINLSGDSLGDFGLARFVRETLEAKGIAPNAICFEITETSAVANLAAARQFIEELRGIGVRFSLDDFGAGMSSFTYLKHLPVDYLKIDGSFVRQLLDDPVDLATVRVFNTLGQLTGKQTIAEFAESEAIVVRLAELGVDYAHGYAIARPLPFTLESCQALARQLWSEGSAFDGLPEAAHQGGEQRPGEVVPDAEQGAGHRRQG